VKARPKSGRRRNATWKEAKVNRITQLDPAQATGETKRLFDEVQSRLGVVSNFLRVLGNAPAALEGYLNLAEALARGSFTVKVREQIALTVAVSNLCSYCLSAHTFAGREAGLTPKEIADASHVVAEIPKTDAILKLARNIVVERGEISDSELEQARTRGLTDGEIIETVANVALNILTNYVNHAARTAVDFVEVKLGEPALDTQDHWSGL
jgi:uncharacterized peroxidase-related enzyme